MTRLSVALVAALAALGNSLPSSAEAGTNYFHCDPNHTTPVNNVNLVADSLKTPSWNTTAPVRPLADPGACFAVGTRAASSGNYKGIYDFNAEGSYEGVIDAITVKLYVATAGASRTGDPIRGRVKLGINGKSMFGAGSCVPPSGCPGTGNFIMLLAAGPPGVSIMEFTITDIGYDLDDVHLINLTVNNITDGGTIFLLDATETPSSITFNPTTYAATVVPATTPGL